jgi:hypothetical protein
MEPPPFPFIMVEGNYIENPDLKQRRNTVEKEADEEKEEASREKLKKEKQDRKNRSNVKQIVSGIALFGSFLLILFVWMDVTGIRARNRHTHHSADPSSSSSAFVVQTTHGPVRGYQTVNGLGWQGIPYAAAPIGALRWKPTEARANWTDSLDCTAIKTMCVQPSGEGSEDCLYLNVYSSLGTTEARTAPVLFYIHGGDFMWGSTAGDDFSAFLASSLNNSFNTCAGVVVVQVAYRLGIIGFLASAELSQEQGGTSGSK